MTHCFPGFRVIERIHASPRSTVSRAIRLADSATVVVKQASTDVVAAEPLRRVQHEYDILSSLRGAGVVEVQEILRDGRHAALVIEDLGASLAVWLAERRLSLAEVLDIGVAVVRGLVRIHAAGVVHRDINPNNIVYDPSTGRAKIIDFDLALRTGATLAAVSPTAIEGTLHYMAPEQTGRFKHPVDGRADLYSLGITLYELLTQRRPFDGEDVLAIVHAHLAEQPQRVDIVVPSIPSVVADIVAKLIAKPPDQRYQASAGLLADLERCRAALGADGRIASFSIGRDDISARFELPERLYGRDTEVRALLDAFERTARGAVETVLVAGYSGIGKSSVVREISTHVMEHRGYFTSGKFEQLNRDVPYSAVVSALGSLISQILAEPEIECWRTAINDAIGDEAPLVRSLVPAIERILGPQPPPPAVDADTARRRLASGLAGLVQVFAQTQHPLVVFLDDMQWADAASLQLLTQLAASQHTAALLVIEAFRDNEVTPAHPFALALREHERCGATISRIQLAPLDLSDTTDLVADALRRRPHEVAEAAALIWRKTDGNPFFIRQFLQILHDDGYLSFDPDANAFVFDMAKIDRAAITDNVAELLAHKLGKLPAATRETLITAAAIGNEFDVATLAIVAKVAPAAVHASLAPAIDADLLHRLADQPGMRSDRYRFQHDRIQQAAYEAAAGDVREQLHLTIARHLLSSSSSDELDARLFEIVHHLSCAIAKIDDAGERARFAELALQAGRRARRAGAFDVAATMLRSTCALLDHGDPRWFAAHLELAEALALGGCHDEARALVRTTAAYATPRDRASLDALDTMICIADGRMSEALECGRRATALLGVDLPSDPALRGQEIAGDIAAIMAALARDPIERWIDFPDMRDADKLAAMTAMLSCIPAAYQFEPQLLVLISTRLVALSLRHGNCAASARGYGTFAITLWVLGDYDLAFRFGQLSVELVHRLDARAFAPAIEFQFAAFIAPWRLPIDEACERLRSTISRGLEIGDLTHAGYASSLTIALAQFRGAPLEDICQEARRYHKLCTRLGLPEIERWLSWFPWHARSWTGAPLGAGEQDIDAAEIERVLTSTDGSQSMATMWRILEQERRFWRGDFAAVVDHHRVLEPMLASVPGNPVNAEVRFYHCLAAISIGACGPELDASRAKLAGYARACPANFGHMSALVDAELARARGDVAAAIALYDDAIDAAAEQRFFKVEVIGHELAARFWLERGKPAFAAVHLGHARDVCEYWGARPRARELELRRRSLGAATDLRSTLRSTTGVASTLDFATVVKASQAIASDVVLDSLLAKIMAIIIENTGAQAGAIILDSEGALLVRASKQPGAAVSVSSGVELAHAANASAGASEGIVRYAMRTCELVALGDATRHPLFRLDPYVRARRPRSVLCLPIVHQDRVLGAVYLENNLIADAFTVERLEAPGILVAQLAISIENAMMFSRLEQRVAERTQALTEANRQLREQAIVRERMESELRLAQKLQSVGQLAAGVAHEINTPMQYIGDNLVFISETLDALLGLIDAYRGARDPATHTLDPAVMRSAEETCDLEYLRSNGPEACVQAREGVARVSKIVVAMKAFSHPDRHDKTAANLNDAVRNTLVVAQNAYRHVADLATDFGDLPSVVCHVGELNQVFLNLVVNAAHAIEDVVHDTGRRGTISVRTCVERAGVVLVTISDTGAGIPEAIRSRVFDPFFTTKEVGRGTGQGLALARTVIVDRHGGSISFETSSGTGTTFFVRIPI